MAELQCPACGQLNPDHLETCQHCQADLSALVSGPGDMPDESPMGMEGDDLADWLLSMREEEPDDDAGDEPDYPDEGDPGSPSAPGPSPSSAGIPDWLAALSDEVPPAAPEQPADSPEDDLADPSPAEQPLAEDPPHETQAIPPVDSPEGPPGWLTDLAEGEDSVEISGSSMQVGDLPDWIEGLVSSAGQLKAPPPAAEPETESPQAGADWLADLRGDDEGADSPDSDQPSGEIPDWLEGMDAIHEEIESTSMPAGDPDEGDPTGFAAEDEALDPSVPQVPDWIAQLANQDPDPRESLETTDENGEEAPDWLEKLDSMAESPASEPEPDARAEETADPAGEGPTAPEPDGLAQPGFGEGIPDWLDELQSQTPPIFGEIQPGGDRPGEALPDWLQASSEEAELAGEDLSFEEESADPEPSEPAGAGEAQEDMPDWLSGMTLDAEAGEFEGASDEEEAIPDWLAGFEQPEVEEIAEEPDDEALPDWLTTMVPAEDQPAGTAEQPPASMAEPGDFSPAAEAAGVPQVDEPGDAQEEADGIPDWLSNLQEQVPSLEQQEAGEVQDWDVDLPEGEQQAELDDPEWLPAGEPDEKRDPLPAFSQGPDEIAPGDVPDWLEAMRPEDDAPAPVAPEVSDAPEQYGPLAGMRGLLSAEPGIGQAGKPEAYSVKLRISDAQQGSMEALRSMVEAETEPQPAGRKGLFSEQGILRWIIVTLLFLVVIFPFFLDLPISGLPPMARPMGNLGRLINDLPAGAPALVIVDFEPGMSGELNAAAGAVIDHLMLRETPLALVSSSPLGPALGERLVSRELAQHGYAYGQDYVNLGYIPGGATGLQNFANFPRASLPLGYDGLPFWGLLNIEAANPWNQAPLQNVGALSDFGLTLLVTDNPDTTRSWIEQVHPKLKPGTFVVIASAQAEPLILPYYNSGEGQVAVLVTGVAGGASYEAFLTREGPGRAYWDSLGLGALAAIVLLFGAGSFNLFLYYRQLESERKGRR